MPTGQTDRPDGRKTVTLRFPLDAASVNNTVRALLGLPDFGDQLAECDSRLCSVESAETSNTSYTGFFCHLLSLHKTTICDPVDITDSYQLMPVILWTANLLLAFCTNTLISIFTLFYVFYCLFCYLYMMGCAFCHCLIKT